MITNTKLKVVELREKGGAQKTVNSLTNQIDILEQRFFQSNSKVLTKQCQVLEQDLKKCIQNADEYSQDEVIILGMKADQAREASKKIPGTGTKKLKQDLTLDMRALRKILREKHKVEAPDTPRTCSWNTAKALGAGFLKGGAYPVTTLLSANTDPDYSNETRQKGSKVLASLYQESASYDKNYNRETHNKRFVDRALTELEKQDPDVARFMMECLAGRKDLYREDMHDSSDLLDYDHHQYKGKGGVYEHVYPEKGLKYRIQKEQEKILLEGEAKKLLYQQDLLDAPTTHSKKWEARGKAAGEFAVDCVLWEVGGQLVGSALRVHRAAQFAEALRGAKFTEEAILDLTNAIKTGNATKSLQQIQKTLLKYPELKKVITFTEGGGKLKKVSMLTEAMEGGVGMEKAAQGVGMVEKGLEAGQKLQKSATTLKKVPLNLAQEVAQTVGGTLKKLKNGKGYMIEVGQGKKPILIRLMNSGSGKRKYAYFRVAKKMGGRSYTARGISSSERALTHFTINQYTLKTDILKILSKVKK